MFGRIIDDDSLALRFQIVKVFVVDVCLFPSKNRLISKWVPLIISTAV